MTLEERIEQMLKEAVENEQSEATSKTVEENEELTEDFHRVKCSLSDPEETEETGEESKSTRTAKIAGAKSKEDAIDRAKKYYKKLGFKVHSAEHIGTVNESKVEGQEEIDEGAFSSGALKPTDTLTNQNGEQVKLDEPKGSELPAKGFDVEDNGYQAPAEDGSAVQVIVSPTSDRLQLLEPFSPWDGKNITGAKLLIKAEGKCTTDHISMAGPWLKYRGHLDNISNNMLIGAVNFFNKETNRVKNQLTGEYGEVPAVQRAYKAAGVPSIVVGDQNYGEGSSREHAAMEPRHLGVKAVLVKSFARIHETNLKKQGMLALTFVNPEDYDKIQEDDTFDFINLESFAPNTPLQILITHADGTTDTILANHTYNEQQIGWFKAGSALNLIAEEAKNS
jgi:aconitase A/regulator of replication initiation timing